MVDHQVFATLTTPAPVLLGIINTITKYKRMVLKIVVQLLDEQLSSTWEVLILEATVNGKSL